MCGTRAEGYAPKQFSTTSIADRRSDGIQLMSEEAIVCSPICKAHWLMQSTTKYIEELLGDE
jgi:hypothetical protein